MEAAAEFQSTLEEQLTFNSKPVINMLTMVAEDNVDHAGEIVQVIESHIEKAPSSKKLPALYLIDSIIKNIRTGPYIKVLTQNIVLVFVGVFEKVDEKTRQAMYKLRQTWVDYFPNHKLYALDVRVRQIDPAWPVTAAPEEGVPNIHVNPRFIKSSSSPETEEDDEAEARKKKGEEQQRKKEEYERKKQDEAQKKRAAKLLEEQQAALKRRLEFQRQEKFKQQQEELIRQQEEQRRQEEMRLQEELMKQEELRKQELARQQDEIRKQADAEAKMRSQLLEKQQELFRLQQQQLEFDLAEAKARLEERARDVLKQEEELRKRAELQKIENEKLKAANAAQDSSNKVAKVNIKSLDLNISKKPVPVSKSSDVKNDVKRSPSPVPASPKPATVSEKNKKVETGGPKSPKKSQISKPSKDTVCETFNLKAKASTSDVITAKTLSRGRDKGIKKTPHASSSRHHREDSEQQGRGSKSSERKKGSVSPSPLKQRVNKSKSNTQQRPINSHPPKSASRSPSSERETPLPIKPKPYREEAQHRSTSRSSSPERGRSRSPRNIHHERPYKRRSGEDLRQRDVKVSRGHNNRGSGKDSARSRVGKADLARQNYRDRLRESNNHSKDRNHPRGRHRDREEDLEEKIIEEPPAKKSKSAEEQKEKGTDENLCAAMPIDKIANDITDLFGKEDKDYRSLPPIPKLQINNNSLPDSGDLPMASPSSAGWAKFKADRPQDFPFIRRTSTEFRTPLQSPPNIGMSPPFQRGGIERPGLLPTPVGPQFVSSQIEAVDIPKPLMIKNTEEILKQADDQLRSGKISHEQHQEILKQLNELYNLQKLKQQMLEQRDIMQVEFMENEVKLNSPPKPLKIPILPCPPSPSLLLDGPPPPAPLPHMAASKDPRVRPARPGALLGDGPGALPPPRPPAARERLPRPMDPRGPPRGPPCPAMIGEHPRIRPHMHPGMRSGPPPPGMLTPPKVPILRGPRPPTFQLDAMPSPRGRTGSVTTTEYLDFETYEPLTKPWYDLEKWYVPQHDARWLMRCLKNVDKVHTMVINGRFCEIALHTGPKTMKIAYEKVEVYLNQETGEVSLNGEVAYVLGEPEKEVLVNGKKVFIYIIGQNKTIWIDNQPFEMNYDAPPIVVDLGEKTHQVHLNSFTKRVYVDGHDVCPITDQPQHVDLAYVEHELRFNPPSKKILIDGELCDLKFDQEFPVVELRGKNHGIRFDGDTREILINHKPYQVPISAPRKTRFVTLKPHLLAFGGPGHEVIIDDLWYAVKFGGPPRVVMIGGKPITVQLNGNPPEVKILGEMMTPDQIVEVAGPQPSHTEEESPVPQYGTRQNRERHHGPETREPLPGPRPREPLPGPGPREPMPGPGPGPRGPLRFPHRPMGMPGPRDPRMDGPRGPPMHPRGPRGMRTPHHLGGRPPPSGPDHGLAPRPAGPRPLQFADLGGSNSLVNVNVNDLFSKLVAAGIIEKKDATPEPEEKPASTADPTPPSKTTKTNSTSEPTMTDSSAENLPEMMIPVERKFEPVPCLTSFKTTELKKMYRGALQQLFVGIQCSSCGMRFVPDQMDKYREHLDWHFRQNRRDKDEIKVARHRKWYFAIDDWIGYEEVGDLEEKTQSAFFDRVLQSTIQQVTTHSVGLPGTGEIVSCPAAGADSDDVCEICREAFEQFWDEDEEEWHLRDAIRVNHKTYHPVCYEDAKNGDTSMLDTTMECEEEGPAPLAPSTPLPDPIANPIGYLTHFTKKMKKEQESGTVTTGGPTQMSAASALQAAMSSSALAKEPVVNVKKEPVAVVKKEPIAVVRKEPIAVVRKEPMVVVKKEPVEDVCKEPVADARKEHVADETKEPDVEKKSAIPVAAETVVAMTKEIVISEKMPTEIPVEQKSVTENSTVPASVSTPKSSPVPKVLSDDSGSSKNEKDEKQDSEALPSPLPVQLSALKQEPLDQNQPDQQTELNSTVQSSNNLPVGDSEEVVIKSEPMDTC